MQYFPVSALRHHRSTVGLISMPARPSAPPRSPSDWSRSRSISSPRRRILRRRSASTCCTRSAAPGSSSSTSAHGQGPRRREGRDRQGLRVLQGPVRRLHPRGAQGARREGHQLHRYRASSCRSTRSIASTSTRPTTSAPDKGGERAYRPARRGAGGDRPRGAGAVRGPRQAVPGPGAAHGDDVLVMEQLHYADELKKASDECRCPRPR